MGFRPFRTAAAAFVEAAANKFLKQAWEYNQTSKREKE